MMAKNAAKGSYMQIIDGYFKDDRWANGRWDMSKFAGADGTTDWDKVCASVSPEEVDCTLLTTTAHCSPDGILTQVIDAEMARRKLLEDTPIPSTNEDPVLFDPSEIPFWAWVKRFHLPEVG